MQSSTYAVFHALTTSNSDVLIGPAHPWPTDSRRVEPEVKRNQPRVSADALNFADLFCKLQDERHSADYNPRATFHRATFTIQAATSWLDSAEAAITRFLQTSRSERAAVAVLTLIRTR